MAKKSLQKGKQAEQQVKQKLLNAGWQFVTANFSSKFGEIDLIFLDDDQLVFIEVKARKSYSLTHPLEAITPNKLNKIIITAEYFLQTNPNLPQFGRIDAVSVIGEGENLQIVHHPNISQL